jgi:hypothetical protein
MDRELVKVLARRVVAQQAPGEQEAFDSLADHYLDDPNRAKTSSRGDAPLGSGLATAVPYVTPAAIYVCGRVIELITDEVLKDAAQRIKRKLPWPRKKGLPPPVHAGEAVSDPASEPGLDTEDPLARARELLSGHEAKVRSVALDAGIAYGLPRERAEELSDVLVEQLFGENPATQPPDPAAVAADPAVSPKPESADTPTDPLPRSAD